MEEVWQRIIENFSPGKVRDIEEWKRIDTQGKSSLDVIADIEITTKRDSEDEPLIGVVISKDFFVDLSSRTVRKYLQPLKWRRVGSRKQAREERVTPYDLMREAQGNLRKGRYYGGMDWRGFDRHNRTFLLYSWLEGFELFSIAPDLISIRRYDIPDELREEVGEERDRISRELAKLTGKRVGDLKQRIMERGGIRVGKVPSRTDPEKLYDDMRIDSLPVAFRGMSHSPCHGTWFNITSRHDCKDKQMFITYLRPKEELLCAHDIAFLMACHASDTRYRKDPRLLFIPFPDPNSDLVDANARYRKQVFKDVNGRRVPLNKIEREALLWCYLKATHTKFF